MNPLAKLFGISRLEVASPMADRSHLEAVTFAHLAGIDLEGLPVTRTQAMSIAAVARGRHLITGTIARLPLVTMQGERPAAAPAPLLERPEQGRPRFQTLAWTVDAMMFYGRAWWLVASKGTNGYPVSVQWVPEWETRLDEQGNLIQAYGRDVNPSDVIRIDAPHEGLLNYAGDRLRAAIRLDRAALVASSNPVPAVELHQTSGTALTSEQANELVATYSAQRSKSGVSYSSQNIETRTHGAQPENLLIDGRKASALDIARLMNLPAWALDAPSEGSSITYSNTPSRSRELLDYTLAPYMEAITARLSSDDVLGAGSWARFNTDPLLFEDFASRMNAYKTALETGVYTLDDLKARENGAPLEPTR